MPDAFLLHKQTDKEFLRRAFCIVIHLNGSDCTMIAYKLLSDGVVLLEITGPDEWAECSGWNADQAFLHVSLRNGPSVLGGMRTKSEDWAFGGFRGLENQSMRVG